MLLLLISFVAGVLTILAPCVFPLLPIIIGGSLDGGAAAKSRPYIIAASLAASVIGFTLLLKVSTSLVNLSPKVLTYSSGGIIIALGLVSLFPKLWERLIIRFNLQADTLRLLGAGQRQKGKYVGPILIGLALGPVFSSCSPTYAFILASVLPRNFASGLLYLVVYSFALVLALLAVSLLGRRFISRFDWAVDTHSRFRRGIGIVFIIIGLAVMSGYDIKAETWLGNHLAFDEAHVEQQLLSTQNKGSIDSKINNTNNSVLNVPSTPAPQFVGLTNWINSPPLQLSSLRGKVVLVDFWTYSCINCIRSLPYVEKWYQTYQSQGLVVIGVNTPEFAFEHDPTNVAAAVLADKLTYPVALDNNYGTWDAFNNDSWPADYLIDKQGNIRYVALGEGDYDTTEKAIQALLGVDKPLQEGNVVVPIAQTQTPETYFGTERAQGYLGSTELADGSLAYKSDSSLGLNEWTLGGQWDDSAQQLTSQSAGSTLTFKVEAKDVYVVASSANNTPETVDVGLSSAVAGQYGADAPGGTATISTSRLYHIVSLKQFGETTVTLHVPAGVSLYTFTFGS